VSSTHPGLSHDQHVLEKRVILPHLAPAELARHAVIGLANPLELFA
jgi:hypothetical protein